MNFSFSTALDRLGANAAFTLANAARPASSYLLNSILPERPQETYSTEGGSMIIRSTMAGPVAMDSPYPEGGYIQYDSVNQKTFKVANKVTIPEAALRTLQYQMNRLGFAGRDKQLMIEATNFFNKVILQAHFDATEWMRGQALTKGELVFNFNGKHVNVDYGLPAENTLTSRTGNDAYGGSTSKWWVDLVEAQRILRGGLSLVLMNSTTLNAIIYNPVNDVRVLERGTGFARIARMVTENGVWRPSEDAREQVSIVVYDMEGDLADPETNGVQNVKFIEDGYVSFIGNNQVRGYEVGQGSTVDPAVHKSELGYVHLAPTVESGGVPGRWGKLYTPANREYQLVGEGVANIMPVIDAPSKLVIAHTAI